MKVLIADDEAPARSRLRGLLAELDSALIVVAEAGDGKETLRRIAETAPDLVLLDVRMPRMNGLSAARAIAALPQPPAVIFATAHDEYAVEAFEVSAVDYLLKPVRKDRLAAALHKAQRFTEATWRKLEAALPAANKPTRSHLCVYCHGELRLVPVGAVAYFRSEQKYTTVRTEESEVPIEDSLISLEEEYGDRFLRIHRNALVATDRVVRLEKLSGGSMGVRLHGIPEVLEVSRRHLPAVRARLKQLAKLRGKG